MTQALIKPIDPSLRHISLPIELIWNELEVDIVDAPRANGKYKKVTLEARQALITLVKEGSSIINAAKSLNINYSTAKSIFQNIKARASGKHKRKRFVQTDSDQQTQNIKSEEYSRT